MIEGENTRQLRAQVPSHRLRAKQRNTVLGAFLMLFGALMCCGSFWLIARQAQFDKWLLAPMAGGFFLALLGAHLMSGEMVGAFVRDFSAAVIPWKTGNRPAAEPDKREN